MNIRHTPNTYNAVVVSIGFAELLVVGDQLLTMTAPWRIDF